MVGCCDEIAFFLGGGEDERDATCSRADCSEEKDARRGSCSTLCPFEGEVERVGSDDDVVLGDVPDPRRRRLRLRNGIFVKFRR